MKRTAIVAPHSIGAISAYRQVIKDISEVLGDPAIDMARLFFAVMIQSGITGFALSDFEQSGLVGIHLLTDRVTSLDYSRVAPVLRDIDSIIRDCAKDGEDKKRDDRDRNNLIAFLQDLYMGASLNRPVATVMDRPSRKRVHQLLRDDLAVVIDALLSRLQTIEVEAPVARFEIPQSEIEVFRTILQSDVFDAYAGGHTLFESASKPLASITTDVAQAAKGVIAHFPTATSLKTVAIRSVNIVPDLLEMLGGRVLGKIATPFSDVIADALHRDQRVLIYTFYPVWRQIWDSKLDKIRIQLAEERARQYRQR